MPYKPTHEKTNEELQEAVDNVGRNTFAWHTDQLQGFDALSEQVQRKKRSITALNNRIAEFEAEHGRFKEFKEETPGFKAGLLGEFEKVKAELGDRDKRIEEFESRRHDEAKSFIADLSKLRQRAEKAEAERDKCEERIEEVEKWNSTLYKERNLALAARDELQATLSIDPILIWVSAELVEATRKFDKFNSTHEGYAVILEELDELWSCVKNNMTDVELRKEAVQVATMAVRFIMDCTCEDEKKGD